jgi:NAD-dependent SIR2 family protein deacetylase
MNYGWKYQAILDQKNIKELHGSADSMNPLSCRDQHGKIYPFRKNQFKPPLHPNCRCTWTVVSNRSEFIRGWAKNPFRNSKVKVKRF